MEGVRRLSDTDSPTFSRENTHFSTLKRAKRQLTALPRSDCVTSHFFGPQAMEMVNPSMEILGTVRVVCDANMIPTRRVCGLRVASILTSK